MFLVWLEYDLSFITKDICTGRLPPSLCWGDRTFKGRYNGGHLGYKGIGWRGINDGFRENNPSSQEQAIIKLEHSKHLLGPTWFVYAWPTAWHY